MKIKSSKDIIKIDSCFPQFQHKIRSLDVEGCSQLTEKSLELLNHQCTDTLLELKLCSNLKKDEDDESYHSDYKEVIDNSLFRWELHLFLKMASIAEAKYINLHHIYIQGKKIDKP